MTALKSLQVDPFITLTSSGSDSWLSTASVMYHVFLWWFLTEWQMWKWEWHAPSACQVAWGCECQCSVHFVRVWALLWGQHFPFGSSCLSLVSCLPSHLGLMYQHRGFFPTFWPFCMGEDLCMTLILMLNPVRFLSGSLCGPLAGSIFFASPSKVGMCLGAPFPTVVGGSVRPSPWSFSFVFLLFQEITCLCAARAVSSQLCHLVSVPSCSHSPLCSLSLCAGLGFFGFLFVFLYWASNSWLHLLGSRLLLRYPASLF